MPSFFLYCSMSKIFLFSRWSCIGSDRILSGHGFSCGPFDGVYVRGRCFLHAHQPFAEVGIFTRALPFLVFASY